MHWYISYKKKATTTTTIKQKSILIHLANTHTYANADTFILHIVTLKTNEKWKWKKKQQQQKEQICCQIEFELVQLKIINTQNTCESIIHIDMYENEMEKVQ